MVDDSAFNRGSQHGRHQDVIAGKFEAGQSTGGAEMQNAGDLETQPQPAGRFETQIKPSSSSSPSSSAVMDGGHRVETEKRDEWCAGHVCLRLRPEGLREERGMEEDNEHVEERSAEISKENSEEGSENGENAPGSNSVKVLYLDRAQA